MKKKYAIYGGSFDPIHVGHIDLAEHAVKECGLDKLIFMPAHVSPFKQDKNITGAADRCRMIASILKYNSAFCLSHFEINKTGPSYTVETLRHWKSILDGSLYFVLGFDSLTELDTWRMGPEIIMDYPLITCTRPDTVTSRGMAKIEEYRKTYGAHITILHKSPVDASSSEIREMVRNGESISGLVPPEVEEYIYKHDLYR